MTYSELKRCGIIRGFSVNNSKLSPEERQAARREELAAGFDSAEPDNGNPETETDTN